MDLVGGHDLARGVDERVEQFEPRILHAELAEVGTKGLAHGAGAMTVLAPRQLGQKDHRAPHRISRQREDHLGPNVLSEPANALGARHEPFKKAVVGPRHGRR
jgi:hypothetical protein